MSDSQCIVCGRNEQEPLFRTRDRHYGIRGEFNIERCTCCGLVKLNPIPTEAELAQYYSESYYAYRPIAKLGRLATLKRRLSRSPIPNHNPVFSNPGDFLDIGCGSGTYLNHMQSLGWRVKGVEPSAYGVATGRSTGFEIFHGTLLDAKFPSNSFDYVRSNHSFEHMPNPVQVLAEIYRIVRPGGKIYIGVPNVDSIPFRLFGRYWWYMGAPVHTYSYSVKTLTTLIQRAGFRVESVHYNSNYESLQGSLQIYLNRNTSRLSGEGWIYRSRSLRLLANVLERMVDAAGQGDAIEVIATK